MTTPEPIQYQLSVSTGDEESGLNSGVSPFTPTSPSTPILDPGVYRVIDGQLFKLVPGAPPTE